MFLRVSYQGKEQEISIQESSKIKDLLEKMNINRESVIVSKNMEIVPDTEVVSEKDRIDIVRITSGG